MTSTLLPADVFLTLTLEVFAALVDGEPGLVDVLDTSHLTLPVHAWVDIAGPVPGRVLLSTTADTADELTHSLLRENPDTTLDPEDVTDALGELANVLGGNVKALLPEPSALTLPRTGCPPTLPGTPDPYLPLAWRGQPVAVAVWLGHTGRSL